MENVKTTFVKIEPVADPVHGKPCARSSHGLSLVNNGKRIVLYGGEHVARTPIEDNESLWIADLGEGSETSSAQWRCVQTKVYPPKRVAHAQAACGDTVYIFGGRAGVEMEEAAMNDLWKLNVTGDTGTETWTEVVATQGTPPENRSFHKMIAIGSKLYVFGGCGAEARLADLHCFDTVTSTWTALGTSTLRGRGGPNVMPFNNGSVVGIVAGFAGEETNDGHLFDVSASQWNEKLMEESLDGLRPRSVCCSASFPSVGVNIIFGGEVDPSERGHEGAGGFENDLVFLDEKTGKYLGSKPSGDEPSAPETRGWSDAASIDYGTGKGALYVYGGLSGDDTSPKRLDDLWCLKIQN